MISCPMISILHRGAAPGLRASMPAIKYFAKYLPLPYHITRPCKIKLDASTLSLANFTLLRGFRRKNHLLTYEPATTTPIK